MTIEGALKYPAVLFVAFAATYLLVPVVQRLCTYCEIIDRPDARRLHLSPVARGGGVAIFIGFHVACLLMFALTWRWGFGGSITPQWWLSFIPISTAVVVTGLVDDSFNLPWSTKLAAQILCATAMFLSGVNAGHILGVALPYWIDWIITVAWFVGLTNAFNLIDGMDGLASGLAGIAALGLGGVALIRFQPTDAMVLFALGGACLAFLRFNFHPAKIFLGDAGSMFLGFTLAAVALSSSTKTTTIAAIGVPFLAVGVPVFDTLLAVWRRSVRAMASSKESRLGIMKADMDHLHHRLLRLGLSQRRVALILYGLNVALVSVGLLGILFNEAATGIFIISFVVAAYISLRHLVRLELWDSGALILRGLARPSRRALWHVLAPVIDAGLLLFSFLSAALLTSQPLLFDQPKVFLATRVPFWCGFPFIAMAFAGTYARLWSRARTTDIVVLATAIFGGGLIALGVETTGFGYSKDSFLLAILHIGFSSVLIVGLRAIPRVIQDMMGLLYQPEGKVKTVMIYGAGGRGLLYLAYRNLNATAKAETERIIGFIDDNLSLHQKIVHGYRVLGGILELQNILRERTVDKIVITSSLTPQRRHLLLELAQRTRIELKEWTVLQQQVGGTPPVTQPIVYELRR